MIQIPDDYDGVAFDAVKVDFFVLSLKPSTGYHLPLLRCCIFSLQFELQIENVTGRKSGGPGACSQKD
jgi:hypothetical protein